MKQKKAVQNGGVAKEQKVTVAGGPAKSKFAKNSPKKAERPPVKVVPPKDIEDEEEDSEDEDDSGADVAGDVVGGKDSDDEQEIDDDDEDEDDEEEDEDESSDEEETAAKDLIENEAEEDDDDDENDSNEAEEDDNEEPTEEPIGKISSESPVVKKKKEAKSSNNSGITKIKTGALPKDFPTDQVLVVKNLPKKFKQIDIVEVFAKYGTLHTINPVYGPVGSIAYVAYTTAEAAQKAAAATNNTAKVKDIIISVTQKPQNSKKQKNDERQLGAEEYKRKIEESKPRTIYVKNLKPKTTEAQVMEHFGGCGTIENCKVFQGKNHCYGFVAFADEKAIPSAKKLHNSVLNGSTVWVLRSSEQSYNEVRKDPKRTISIKNTQNLECFPGDKINAIFSKCGEIEGVTILCKKHVLAFVTFKDEKSAKKALKLNGTSAQGLELEIEEYKVMTPKSKTAIFVQNVKPGVTEEEVRELFSQSGAIESAFVQNGFAIVKFQDTDGFCKSFLLNESLLQGQMIFVEPYSDKKQFILKSHHGKRPMSHNNKGGYNKRFKPN